MRRLGVGACESDASVEFCQGYSQKCGVNHSVCTYKTRNSQIDESRAGVETRVLIGSKSGLTNTLARKLGANVEMISRDARIVTDG